VQEALTNVARHACVREAVVQVWVNDAALFLQIEDAGCGRWSGRRRRWGLSLLLACGERYDARSERGGHAGRAGLQQFAAAGILETS